MVAVTQDAEQLARLLALRSGKTPAEVIREALEQSAQASGVTVALKPRRKPSFERMMEISDRFAHHPVLDDRTPDEIIGYDSSG
jgi:antitoxin VapB